MTSGRPRAGAGYSSRSSTPVIVTAADGPLSYTDRHCGARTRSAALQDQTAALQRDVTGTRNEGLRQISDTPSRQI
jgi:hypothetical protein